VGLVVKQVNLQHQDIYEVSQGQEAVQCESHELVCSASLFFLLPDDYFLLMTYLTMVST
jgi:hypothetical protein